MDWNNLEKNKVKEIIGNLLFLLLFIFLPLIINLVIALFPQGNRWNAVSSKIIPGEILAYGLGLIAPVFVLIVKSHGKGYKIPALKTVFGLSITLYIIILLLIFIAKNGLIAGIDYNPSRGLYFWFSIATLITSLGLRAFIDIQNECFSDFKQERENQQNDFNKGFINSLQKNGN